MSEYAKLLQDPRWQKKRLEILQRDGWACRLCGATEKTLHVHHLWYGRGLKPWDYSADTLQTLCADCHQDESGAAPEALDKLREAMAEAVMFSEAIEELASLVALLKPPPNAPFDTAEVIRCVAERIKTLGPPLSIVAGHHAAVLRAGASHV